MNEMNLNFSGYIAAAVLTAAFMPIAIRFARTFRIVDVPDTRKIHSIPIPRFGGVAVFVISLMVILLADACGLLRLWPDGLPLLSGAFLMFAVGLWDDLRGLTARQKLVFQCVAAVHLCMAGGTVESFSLGTTTFVFPSVVSWGVSILWLIGLTNAINMTDGLDALASGVGAIVLIFLGIAALTIGNSLLAFCLFVVSGSLAGFLVFNSNPARIFLGDSGSLFLGFLLAGASLQIMQNGPINLYSAPLTALLVPVLDTLLVMLRRHLERRSVFSADQNHFHHRLLKMGYSQWQAVLIIYGLTFCGAMAGLVQLVVPSVLALGLFIAFFTVIVCVFRKVGAVRFREMIAGLRKNASIKTQMRHECHRCDTVELHFQKADTLEQWWEAVCLAAESLGFRGLHFSNACPDQTGQEWLWSHPDPKICREGMISMTVPVYDLNANVSHRLRVDVQPGDSFESAGRTLTLFARLIDKYGRIRHDGYEKQMLLALAQSGHRVCSELSVPKKEGYEKMGA